MTIELRLLPTVSWRGQEVTAPRLRGLLALLAAEHRRGCSTGLLVAGMWPEEQPENPAKALQVVVARARARLGADTIVGTPTGYRLGLGEEQVDASALPARAAAYAERARAGDHAGALAEAEAGLALWDGRGPEPGGGDRDPVAALRAERTAPYRALLRGRALALARTGRGGEAVEPLAELSRGLPHDEEVLLELMRCQAAASGPSAALATYDRYRRALRDELGTNPGAALRALHQELLRGEAPVVRRGVPHEPNPLLGRDADVTAVAGLLRRSRVVSVVGPGGLGKTRLAAAVARDAEQRVVHMVGLAGVARDEDVAAEVASALGAGSGAHDDPASLAAGIAAALGPGPALLVLDNCEHVVRGAAELVGALVAAARELRVLTTSRAPLGLSSESVHPLPELDLANTVELFEQRARAARPGVELPAEAVAALCRRLDGLPLAAELAAARVRVLSVAEIARRLEDRFALLRGGPRDAPTRHRTLHAVVDWSWNLLEPAGQAALRALSVFPGGFTADAAEYVLSEYVLSEVDALSGSDPLDVLEELAAQSLLKVADTPSGTRFRMLETVREFSTARRDEAGETERVTLRFTAWAREFGAARHDAPFGPDALAACAAVRAEQDNLGRALRLALAREDAATVAAVAAVLAALWITESHHARLMALAEDTGPLLSRHRPDASDVEAVRTAAALMTANAFLAQGPGPVRTLAVLRRLPPTRPDTLVGAVATVLCAIPGPLDALCESDEPLLACVAGFVESYVREAEHDLDRALAAARRMLDACGGSPVPLLRIMVPSRLGELCLRTERGEEALRHMTGALHAQEQLGDRYDLLGLGWGMVFGHLQTGELDEAERRLERILLARPEDAADDVFAPDLAVRAEIALARGETEAGLALWRRAADRLGRRAPAQAPAFGTGQLEPWALEIRAASVVAHARHGGLDLVEKLADAETLAAPLPGPVRGALLLALGMADTARGRCGRGARLIALAEAFGWPRNFPTMGSARARAAAECADGTAYADAVSSYAALSPAELCATARELLE